MKFAEEWIDAWSSYELDLILSHYSDDFEMSSPRIVQVMNVPSGALKGKNKVRMYWEKSLSQSPNLFELIEVLVGIESLIVYYHNVTRGKKTAEALVFDPDGLVVMSMAHYD